MYAVVQLGSSQYKVSEGQEVLVDKLKDVKKIEPEVLLFTDGEKEIFCCYSLFAAHSREL